MNLFGIWCVYKNKVYYINEFNEKVEHSIMPPKQLENKNYFRQTTDIPVEYKNKFRSYLNLKPLPEKKNENSKFKTN